MIWISGEGEYQGPSPPQQETKKCHPPTHSALGPLSLGRQLLLGNRNRLERMQWLLSNPSQASLATFLTSLVPTIPQGERPGHPGSGG